MATTRLAFAYDGSLNGDWVAHYAVRLATNALDRRLRLLHLREPTSPRPHLDERIARIAAECRRHDVTLDVDVHDAGSHDVSSRLAALVPPEAMLITGARARPRKLAFLAGTVSARLLASAPFGVVAIRVVHPGVLGQPGRVLLPLAMAPGAAAAALPLLALLGDDLHRLHVLNVREVSRLRFRFLSSGAAERMLDEGRAFATEAEATLRTGLAPHRFELDSSVVVSDDAAKEILIHASKDRSRLVCLGASARNVPERLVHGNPIEQVLRETVADVAVYRGAP
jgi:nucleotide-binding universal stress UspA family protein